MSKQVFFTMRTVCQSVHRIDLPDDINEDNYNEVEGYIRSVMESIDSQSGDNLSVTKELKKEHPVVIWLDDDSCIAYG